MARVYDPVCALVDRAFLDEHRRALASGLEGRVLDLGTGTGRMFDTYAAHSPGIELHALEPDPAMRARATRRARSIPHTYRIVAGVGERLPYRNDRFDAVVSSMVLCSVDDPGRVIAEVERVLKPGGEFRMLEHVRSRGWRGYVQDVVAPFWRRLAGNCRPNRQTEGILADSGLDPIDEIYDPIVLTPIRPFVRARYRLPHDQHR